MTTDQHQLQPKRRYLHSVGGLLQSTTLHRTGDISYQIILMAATS